MANSFESIRGNSDKSEIIPDRFGFKSAGKKYINKNYERIGSILGIEGEGLGNIKRQANSEKKIPDIHEDLSLEQINFYREHYGFPPLTQDEYETVKAQNTSSEAIIYEQVEEVTEVEKTDIDISSDEGEKVESIKTLTRKDFGPMPEDPYNIKNNDLKALIDFFESKPDQFPNGRYVDIRNWADWTPIMVVKPEYINDPNLQWSITKGNDNELIGEFPSKEDAEAEFDRIKKEDKQKALDLLRKARNFTIGVDLDTPWSDVIDVSSEKPTAAEEVSSTDTAPENLVEGEENTGEIIFENDDVENFKFNLQRYSGNDEMRFASIRDDLEELDLLDQSIDDILEQKGIPDIPSKSIKIGDKYFDWWDTHSSGYTYKELAIAQYYGINLDHLSFPVHSATLEPEIGVEQAPASENVGEDLPGLKKLKETLDEVVEKTATKNNEEKETGGALARRFENIKYNIEPDIESNLNTLELDILSERAQEAINKYQLFHQSFSKEYRTPAIQEQYRKLEKEAWDRVEELAHKLGGRIIELPRGLEFNKEYDEDIDIKTRDKLNSDLGYKFNQEGQITHIEINGNTIQLNRPRTVDELLNGDRPARILYHSGEQILNEDPFKKHYKGYWIKGLNPNTIQDMERELSGNQFPQPDIIDDTITPSDIIDDPNSIQYYRNLEPIDLPETNTNQELNGPPVRPIFQVEQGTPNFNSTETYSLEDKSKQDPWSTESRGDTEFDKIFANSININKEIKKDNEMPDTRFEQAEEVQMILSNKGNTVDFEVVDDPESVKLLEEMEPIDLVDRLSQLREQYAEAEEIYNRRRNDPEAEKLFNDSRLEYNEALERMLKLKVAEGQEANIHQIFKDEFIALRDSRVVQSKELQGKWEKRLNPIKEKFVNFVIKHKKIISRLNLAAGVAGGALALTGVGIPLAGGLAVARRMVSATLLGVSTGEGIRSLGEDADINSFWGKIKFQAVIPKLVQESLASSEDEFKQVSGDVLKERLGTLEAYYRLNGGGFTNDNQRQAYEKVLTELARRVQENVIYVENNKDTLQSYWQEQKPQELTDVEIKNLADENLSKRNIIAKSIPFSRNREIERQYDLDYEKYINWEKLNPERYTSELLNTISDKRIVELDKFRKNRKTATITGLGVGLLAGGAVHLSDEFNKPDSVELTDGSDSTAGDPTPEVGGTGSGPGEASAPEAGAVATPEVKPTPSPEIPPTGASAEEALRQAQALAQDVSSLDSAETIWGEIAKQLGTGASEAQIQEAVEKYLGSIKGQDTIFKLAQQTEDGRALLSQWGIDNAGEMSGLSKERLYEVSKYLGEGKLDGLTELSLDNLDALDPAVATTPSSAGAPTIEPGSTERPAPPAGPEVTGAEPPSPPAAETPVTPQSTELPPVASTEFTRGVSEALGATNLTETQLQEVIYSFATSEQGSTELYNQIISNEEGARFLSGFGVNNAADFANLRPDEVYEIAQTVGVENLDKLLGFELNEIILSKFEDAPDMVELARGTRPLDVVNQYISSEIGNLPYDSTLGQQVLNTYLDTADGKQWLYDAIVNNPDVDNQNIQLFREYLRFKDIKSPEDFVSKFNWAEFSGNKNIPTSAFWNQTRLPNGVDKLQPLSTLLKPSRMLGIKDAVRQVLTRQ